MESIVGAPDTHSHQEVATRFIEQYYDILLRAPDVACGFYTETSILSRPDSNGVMTSVTARQAAGDLFWLSYFKGFSFEIENVGSQPSCNGGVLILVNGRLKMELCAERKFTQAFFLARQGLANYVILNDIFSYADEAMAKESNQIMINNDAPEVHHLITEQDERDVVEEHGTPPSEGDYGNSDEAPNSSEQDDTQAVSTPPVDHVDVPSVSNVTAPVAQGEPKMSYVAIVKLMKGGTPKAVPTPSARASIAANNGKTSSTGVNEGRNSSPSTKPESKPEIAAGADKNIPKKYGCYEVEGQSIYVRNLPPRSTKEQVEEMFKKFGSINLDGVQVRSHEDGGYTFAFVEFESPSSAEAAIKASSILVQGYKVFIEARRPRTRAVNGAVHRDRGQYKRGQFPPGEGEHQNGYFKEHRGYRGNHGYRNGADYQVRGTAGRPSNGYQQRSYQNGSAKNVRPNGMKQTVASTNKKEVEPNQTAVSAQKKEGESHQAVVSAEQTEERTC